MYHIDLEETVVGAKRFLALASRLPAYDGALATTATATAQQHDPDNAPETDGDVPVEAMDLLIPGLIDRVEVTPE